MRLRRLSGRRSAHRGDLRVRRRVPRRRALPARGVGGAHGRQAAARAENGTHRSRGRGRALAHRQPRGRIRRVQGGVSRGRRRARARSGRHGARRALPRPVSEATARRCRHPVVVGRRHRDRVGSCERARAAARRAVPGDTRGARRAPAPAAGRQSDRPRRPQEAGRRRDRRRRRAHHVRGPGRRVWPRDPHIDAVLRGAHEADRRSGAGGRQAGDDHAHARRRRRGTAPRPARDRSVLLRPLRGRAARGGARGGVRRIAGGFSGADAAGGSSRTARRRGPEIAARRLRREGRTRSGRADGGRGRRGRRAHRIPRRAEAHLA